ncbi:MAG: hypothetical protein VX951_09750 [Planctomycetota bacterium]|nr:hypothetical protein [Planctomycetota bacterium]
MAQSMTVPIAGTGDRRRVRLAGIGLAWVLTCGTLGSCEMVGRFVEYTDGLRNSEEHAAVVRGVAQVGGFLGLLVSVPLTTAALPFTYLSYLVENQIQPEEADLVSRLLLPSFALLGIGSLLGAPADLVEVMLYKTWAPPEPMTEAEREAFEQALDEDTLPRYPVVPVLPVRRN